MVDDDGETEHERLNRNLEQLLQELRVALPGVQVLFAFLLAVPFNQRFGQVTEFQKALYYVTLLTTAVAAAFLIAPSAMHRIEFRADDKRHIVFTANKLSIIGFAFLGVAMTTAVLLITEFLYDGAIAVITTAIVAGLFFGLWYVVPLARLRHLSRTKPNKRKRSARDRELVR